MDQPITIIKAMHNSIVLMAVCDAHYNFTSVDVGAEGRNSDSGVFNMSHMGRAIADDIIVYPPDEKLSDSRPALLPYFLVGDEAFSLSRKLMRPFPSRSAGNLPREKAVFNYRLSRARRCIENAFGIMASRWRIFYKPINACESTVNAITLACVALHNFLKKTEQDKPPAARTYCPQGYGDELLANGTFSEGRWRSVDGAFGDMPVQGNGPQDMSAVQVRNVLADYFINEGALEWQEASVLFGPF